MRPAFYDFPEDGAAWDVEDAYMFGPDLYVAPVTEQDALEREVYLPAGTDWVDVWSGARYEGGQCLVAAAPIDRIPVFSREDAEVQQVFS